ncbi:MAG: hypothetical protein CVU89_15825 [Firmicutes bacterium HGW-Firmicutes-14]|nr:MAG: hypothetical protein CVU89_15825 [Firmicutes bacterium HGW-Firmicutes-14]
MKNANSHIPVDKLSPRRLMCLDACTRCGECQNWCPVYSLTENEKVTPRAKIKNLKAILKAQNGFWGLFKSEIPPDTMSDFLTGLYECSCCNQCHFVCPSRIDTVELWENVRAAMFISGLGPIPEQRTFCQNLVKYGNPFKKEQSARADWIEDGLQDGTLLQRPELITENKASVLLFIGCTATFDEKVNKIAKHTVNILSKAGIKFGILGTEENCCYGKLRRMGDPTFTQLAQKNIEKLNDLGIDTLVSACAGCFKTLYSDYPKVGRQKYKIYHLSEYLDMLIRQGQIKFEVPVPGQVTYHDPCLLGRHNNIYDAPRHVIEAIPGMELVEMERVRQFSRCCGVGGGLKIANHDLQEAASVRRIKDAEETGAEYLTTPCPTCYAGLLGGALKAESQIKVIHMAELAARSMGINK